MIIDHDEGDTHAGNDFQCRIWRNVIEYHKENIQRMLRFQGYYAGEREARIQERHDLIAQCKADLKAAGDVEHEHHTYDASQSVALSVAGEMRYHVTWKRQS